MKRMWPTLLVLIMIVFFIFRIKSCSIREDRIERDKIVSKYTLQCQSLLDSAYSVFKPVIETVSSDKQVDEITLDSVTKALSFIGDKAVSMKTYDVSQVEFKRWVIDFIELQKMLSCCYLKAYQQELNRSAVLKGETIFNLKDWIKSYKKVSHREILSNSRLDYSNYGDVRFNYHNKQDLTAFSQRLDSLTLITKP